MLALQEDAELADGRNGVCELSEREMDELVEELQAIADLAKDTPINGFPNLNNKWLARSGLQKAIRRGRTQEALTCGANLATADPDGAWRALSTVIVEDVGFGDMDLLALSTVAGLKTLRQKVTTPGRLFMGMVTRACGAVKTRSACELSLGADKDPLTPWAALHADRTRILLTLMRDGKMPMSIQYAATVLVRRRCAKTPGLMNKALELMMEQLGTGPEARAAMMSFERQVDTMNSAVWPLISWGFDKVVEWQADPLPPEKMIAGVGSAGAGHAHAAREEGDQGLSHVDGEEGQQGDGGARREVGRRRQGRWARSSSLSKAVSSTDD